MRECDFCKKEIIHGGKCGGRWDDKPCLLYERDERGKWQRTKVTLEVPLGHPLPIIGESIEVTIRDVEKTIRVYSIDQISWDNRSGLRGVILDLTIGYWTEENGVITEKPKLTVVK